MARERFLFLTDLHGDAATADGGRSAPFTEQDGRGFRIYSNWSARLSGACKIAVAYKCDYFVLGGDSVNGDEADPVAMWEAILNQVEAEYCVPNGGGKIIPVYGNHEDGTAMDISDFTLSYEAELAAGYKLTQTQIWPGTEKASTYCAFSATETNFIIVVLWGASAVETIWDNTGIVFEGALENAVAELDWLKNYALTIGTAPATGGCITAITQHATAPQITTTVEHSLVTGDSVKLFDIVGDMGDDVLNDNEYVITVVDATKFTVPANTTGKTYTSGGKVGVNKPVIVLCHQHLSDSDGATPITADVLSGTPDNSLVNAQTILSTCGQKVTCLCGHYHRVDPNSERIMWEKNVITAGGGRAVDYYNFRGSVLGLHPNDKRGNTFFVVDIDTVNGVENVMTFRHSRGVKDRYNSHDLDHTEGGLRFRSRYE